MKKSIFQYRVTLQSLSPTARMILSVLSSLLIYQMISGGISDMLAFTIRCALLIGTLGIIVSGKGYLFQKK
ncbi:MULTISPECIES: hypothetical protein [Lactobacillales]|uniref:Uncharacterized protein n=1 Tax=Streptococcus suis TaxID=1307 RepID=A0A7T1LFP9_STRSU|nr:MULTISPECIES: hypothetical protein [Lactobacillales]MCQ8785007.1 hypothetical protein [Streptococcus suis]MDW8681506.1 hypothetical protein [Streptococcus suis]QPO27663.1 hypothetical protein I5V48_05935 [Streptococcus suis]QPO28567.1 hypothetical protein I5W22_09390 [Streptococcus suis]QPO29564.1 hypothetical protein I5W22_04535 [Streptococcus suis]